MSAAIALSASFFAQLGGKLPGGKGKLSAPSPDLIVPGEWDALARFAKGYLGGLPGDS